MGLVRSRVRPFTEMSPVSAGGGPVSWLIARRIRPIRPIRRADWDRFAQGDRYARGRWGYTSVAATICGELISRYRLRTALELGPYRRPLIVGADIMDAVVHDDVESEGRTIIHDAKAIPWPVDDGRYDLFVALQVFEHLVSRQEAAFREVRRIARHAVISLPIDWQMEDPTNIHHQISHERVLSWFAPSVPTRVEEGNPEPKKRLIYVFENLTAPEPTPSRIATDA